MEPTSVIFDMDISGDCTNYGALTLLHELCRRNEARLLATTICHNSPIGASAVEILNKYYKNTVPIGILHSLSLNQVTKFPEIIVSKFSGRRLAGEDIPDSVDVMRQTLASQDDKSVSMVICGGLSSAVALLESTGDKYSPLDGRSLVERKVKNAVIMAGNFSPEADPHKPEWNISLSIPAAQCFCRNWPCEAVFTGFEIGFEIQSFGRFVSDGPEDHPGRLAYEVFDMEPAAGGRYSWDHTAVLEAIRPDAAYWYHHEPGRIYVNDEGYTEWKQESNGNQTYLLPRMTPAKIGSIIDELVL